MSENGRPCSSANFPVTLLAVRRHAQHAQTRRVVALPRVTEGAGLLGAARGAVLWIKVHQGGRLGLERDDLAPVVDSDEWRNLGTHGQKPRLALAFACRLFASATRRATGRYSEQNQTQHAKSVFHPGTIARYRSSIPPYDVRPETPRTKLSTRFAWA